MWKQNVSHSDLPNRLSWTGYSALYVRSTRPFGFERFKHNTHHGRLTVLNSIQRYWVSQCGWKTKTPPQPGTACPTTWECHSLAANILSCSMIRGSGEGVIQLPKIFTQHNNNYYNIVFVFVSYLFFAVDYSKLGQVPWRSPEDGILEFNVPLDLYCVEWDVKL